MELIERAQRFKRNFGAQDDSSLPWYKRKIILISAICVLVIVAAVILVCSGYFAGLSASKEKNDNLVPEPESRVALPPVEWDGICPKKHDKCPSSFQDYFPVILISLDGFHPSFMERGFTPTIKKIANCGTHAPYMFPVFPTKTFPNHVSQVTGVYPPYHGIIDNNMYDPIRKKLFKVGQPESLNPVWWQKEPIWVTAQKQGKKAGCFFWPGSEVQINGTYPTYYKKYNSKLSFESRVDQVLAWLDFPLSSRPNFITLYVNQPDYALHHFGTKSKQTNDALSKVDRMIERLISGLQQRDLVNCVNIILMSDHGMSDTDCKRVIDIQNYINVNDTFNTVGPFGRVRPKGRRNATVANEMVSKLRCKSPHLRAYLKEQLPVRYHYADHPRIEPIFLDIDAGWTVVSKSRKTDDSICTGGAHGYDDMFPDMRAIFLAHGPSFKKNYTMLPFLNVEVYEMLAELLDIIPNPNNGTRGSMHYIMTSPKTLSSKAEPESPAVADIPVEETVYNNRLSDSTCYCPESGKQLQIQNLEATRNFHLPFGVPYSAEDNRFLNLLYNEDYVNAFNLKYGMPQWSSFTLKEQTKYSDSEESICWNGDVRIPAANSSKCVDYFKAVETHRYSLQRPLYSPGFSDISNFEQAALITNSVAKSFNHSIIIEIPFNEMLNRWTSQTGEMNVVFGPAFDVFGFGVKPDTRDLQQYFERNGPVPIATHIFAIVTWCSVKTNLLSSCDTSKLKAQGFLLPNIPFPVNCEASADIIAKNVARVADIEELTGLSFYKKLNIYDAIRLRTMMPERPF